MEATLHAMTWLVSDDTYYQMLDSEQPTRCFHSGVLSRGSNSSTQPVSDFHSTRTDVEISSEGSDLKGHSPSHSDSQGNDAGFGHDSTAICLQETIQLVVDVPCIPPERTDGALAATGLWEAKLGLEMPTLVAGGHWENSPNDEAALMSAMGNAGRYRQASVPSTLDAHTSTTKSQCLHESNGSRAENRDGSHMGRTVHDVNFLQLVILHCIHIRMFSHSAQSLVGGNKGTMSSASAVDDRNRNMKGLVAGIWGSHPHSGN